MGEELVAKIGLGLGVKYVAYARLLELAAGEEGSINGFKNNMRHFFKARISLRATKVSNYRTVQTMAIAEDSSSYTAIEKAIHRAVLKMIRDNRSI